MKNTEQQKTYEIEFASTTYRTYYIDANNQEEAELLAFKELDADFDVAKTWKANAEICYAQETDQQLPF